MSHSEDQQLPHWVKIRILDFLNRAQCLEDITRSPQLKDNPESGSEQGYIIGRRVAQRIIDHREVLPRRQYTSLEELKEIKGIGEDKIHDLAYSFRMPAAEVFRRSVYDKGIFPPHWRLMNDTTHFPGETTFREIADYPGNLTEWVKLQVVRLSQEQSGDARIGRLAGELLRRCLPDIYPDPHHGAIALAFWFYRLEADRWFSLERIRSETSAYLSIYPDPHHRLELYLFKGFPNTGTLVDTPSCDGLPVVVNRGEWAITIWRLQIDDGR